MDLIRSLNTIRIEPNFRLNKNYKTGQAYTKYVTRAKCEWVYMSSYLKEMDLEVCRKQYEIR